MSKALQGPGTALERFIDLYERMYEGLAENRHLFKLINNFFFGAPQGAPPYDIEQFHRRMVEVIRQIYLMGLRLGELKETDSKKAAFLVLGVIDFCFQSEDLHPESMDPERAERLLRLAFQGLERNERGRHEMPLS